MLCKDCHHMPSRRNAEYGAACQCRCHDIADASPELLAACKSARAWLSYCDMQDTAQFARLTDAILAALEAAEAQEATQAAPDAAESVPGDWTVAEILAREG